MNIASLTYETILAYVLPAIIVELPLLPYLRNYMKLDLNLSSVNSVLGFAALTLALGLLIDMLSHVIWDDWSKWQRRIQRLIYFGCPDNPSLLLQLIDTALPNTSEQDKVKLVDGIFNFQASQHVYARRNWDWTFHEATRNVVIASFFAVIGIILLAIQGTSPLPRIPIPILIVLIAIIDAFLYRYMKWSLTIYYSYNVNIALGYLFELKHRVVNGENSDNTNAPQGQPDER